MSSDEAESSASGSASASPQPTPAPPAPAADPALAARRVLLGRFVNAGQTCVSPDYVLVAKDIKDRFLEEVRKR